METRAQRQSNAIDDACRAYRYCAAIHPFVGLCRRYPALVRRAPSASAWLVVLLAFGVSCRHGKKETPKPAAMPVATSAQTTPSPSVPDAAQRVDASAGPASTAATPSDAGSPEVSACNEQSAQQFLIDAHFNGRPLTTTSELRTWKDAVARSIRYRTEQYGYFPGFGNPAWNAKRLQSQIRTTHFFGLAVRLHERIIAALACVERALERECAATPYKPHALAGIRDHNTYLDGDVTNHAYGIAIDIDPMRNPCCGCVKPWSESPRCKGKKTDFERMDMPACWIPVFERYGFYWLGHDALRDTMHFEFLGDPAKIAK